MTTIAKRVLNEKRRWISFDLELSHINEKIFRMCRIISSRDYEEKSILQSGIMLKCKRII